MNEKLNPVLAGMLGMVEEIREELINYGGNLEIPIYRNRQIPMKWQTTPLIRWNVL
jgi:hypothetical protein